MGPVQVVFVFLVAAASVTAAVPYSGQDWLLWKQENKKVYKDEATELLHLSIWKENLAVIQHHNEHADEYGFTLSMNSFGDLTDGEFNELYNGFRMEEREMVEGEKKVRSLFVANPDFVPSNDTVVVDWRQKDAVSAVMNQGDCGSCWAFSTTGSLEGQHKLNRKLLISLSEQNLMDCTLAPKYNNMACLGGTMVKAFQYIIDNHGVDTEASYPYLAQTETKCRFSMANVGATMSSFVDIPISEPALTEASLKIGPISVAIDASLASFRFYESGVYYEPQCSTTRLNHGVLLIGYGTDEGGKEYYLVKNSWGTAWGIDGYIKMARNRNNNCGIATVASYPVV